MQNISLVTIKNSVVTKVLKVVFGLYFILAIGLTVIHMTAEFYKAKDNIYQDLATFQKTFEPSLAQALWFGDKVQLLSTIKGMLEIPIIVGVKIVDEGLTPKEGIGVLLNSEGIPVSFDAPSSPADLPQFDNLYAHSFSLYQYDSGVKHLVGKATIYSSHHVVFQKVQYSFTFILLNAIIKTVALWFIFLIVARNLLSRPLALLTQFAKQLNLDNIDKFTADLHTKGPNELKVLEEAFNSMLYKLRIAREGLTQANINLEDNVRERTLELSQLIEDLKEKEQTISQSNILNERHNQIFRAVLNTSVSIEKIPHIQDLLEYTLQQLKPLFQQSRFGMILNSANSDVIENTVFMGIPENRQALYLEAQAQLLETETQQTLSVNLRLAEEINTPKAGLSALHLYVLPLVTQAPKTTGKLIIEGTELDYPSLEIVSLFLKQLTAVIHNKRLSHLSEQLAYQDELTGFGNQNKLAREYPLKKQSTLINLKINKFNEINNGFGFKAGDLVLKQASQIINAQLPNNMELYRLSGSEFGILVEGPQAEAIAISQKIRDTLNSSKIYYKNSRVIVTLAIGIAAQGGGDIFEHAHMALVEAKQSNSIVIYSDEMDTQLQYQKSLQQFKTVQEAFENNMFFPVYQGIRDNRKDSPYFGKIHKYEALMRIKGEDGKLLSPYFFIKALERSGEVNRATKLMIMKSFDDMRKTDFEFSINLTEKDLLDESMLDFVRFQLEGNRITANRVTFEILEGVSSMGSTAVTKMLHDLKGLGCKIAIDDFGAEQSNRAHSHFPG
ncbi:EAL domain-containing protein [Deltaproteobacteria bacterium TL4]